MSGKVYARILGLTFLLSLLTGCGSSNSSTTPSPVPVPGNANEVVAITASGGAPQSAASGKPFSAPFSVTVKENGIRVLGEKVTFTAPPSGPSGIFANRTLTDTEITNSLGVATSAAFTANTTAGTYAVTATVSGATSPASFSLTNIAATSYAFYLSGQETETASFYALAGSVVIDSSGNVLGGEQDYNDGGFGFQSPEPSGDAIIGGSLTFPANSPPGQGILTLNTNNMNLGLNANGVEVFGVQFVNSNHALIMQFDGFATSSGSMDVQTLPSTLSGGYAFAVSGFDSAETPVDFGGVFSVSGSTISNGAIDINDADNLGITTGTALTGTLTAADPYGRGTLTGIKVGGTKVTLNYYTVGPEAIRLIDVDTADTAIGSAFGQGKGAGSFSNASLGSSVMALASTPYETHFAALAQFSTSDTTSSPSNFSGVGDDNEPDNGVLSTQTSKVSGTYSIGSNGYGSLNITNGGLGDFTTLGIYMTDPALNLEDVNNTTGGGGALAIDLSQDDLLPGGAGVVIPQTDTSIADFSGNYAVGWQNYNENCGDCELDMIAQGSMVSGGNLSLTGLVSDPFFSLGTPDATSSGDTFAGTPTPDTKYAGRYTLLTRKESIATVIDGTTGPNFDMVIYQASSDQLFWLDYDTNLITVSLGPVEQQGSLSGLPGASKAEWNSASRISRAVSHGK
jgi:hypothetical protein